MPTALILAANPFTFKWNHSTFPPRQLRLPHRTLPTKPPNLTPFLYTKPPPSLSPRYTLKCLLSPNQNQNQNSTSKSPLEALANTVSNALNALRKPAMAAVLLGLLLMYDPNTALAASGGRIGGRSFSSRSSRSRSSSRSYSVPTRTRTSTLSPEVSSSAPSQSEICVGDLLILVGMFAFVLVLGIHWDRSERSLLAAAEKITVLKLQVGLLGTARTLQRDLNRIAEVADTSSSEGLRYVLTETTLALLRHPDYCISAYSAVDEKQGIEDGEKRFNLLSIEERGKFDEETLVNVNNIKRQSTRSQRATGFSNEYIVITILAAAEGGHKLPTISGSGDLKEALQKLGSIPSSKLLAVEVLWTPQNENDTLSERELLEDYPLLRPL